MQQPPDKLSIREWARDDRPREKLMQHGAQALSDAELIAILIRSGSTSESALDLAKRVLAAAGNDLHRLGRQGVADLTRFKGMGEAKAIGIVAALELGRRRRAAEPAERELVATSAVAHELLRAHLADLPHEEFWLLVLDRGNRLLDRCRVSRGGIHGTVADPKVIFKEALDRRASCLVLGHNHPSGQLRPSEEDIRLTRRLVEGGRLLEIAVQDHIIVTSGGYYSFADNGMM
ncbi:MAG: DNA repair protein RadC [Flavobacteriales bacterium]|jgi:DNA repair protein RadC|nr:DNA repair protein RadC [Flavobacteriales bacterium]